MNSKFKKMTARLFSGLLSLAVVGSSLPALANLTTNIDTTVTADAAAAVTDANGQVFSWDNATVYFLLTDRFNNGDTSNDHSYGRGCDANGNPVSYDNYAAFQGGDFKGITDKINEGYFDDLGVNAIWLSAPYEQIHGYCVGCDGDSFAHYSYHGYYVLDYTESDKNFGTKEEFRELVDTAHKHGIRIVMDIVMNHSGYNTLKDMDEYGFGSVKSGWDSYYYAHQNINNTDYHGYIDYNASADLWAKWWGPNWIRCGLPGYTEGSGDIEGSLAGLPDFKTGSSTQVGIPEVLKTKWTKEGTYSEKVAKYGSSNTVTGYISDWLAEWVREFGVDGFRCDTAKHVETSAWKTLKEKCVKALKEWKTNNPDKALDDLDFWMTGECFGHKAEKSYYYTEGGFDSMINFEFAPAVNSSNIPSAGSVDSVYSRYANSINSDETFNVLSYIASHDTTLAKGDRKYAGSFLLMLPGGIQIYYGDETNRPLINSSFASKDPGAGHQFRSFMNWDSIDSDVLAHWQKLGQFRNNHIAVGAGQHKTISAYDSTNGYTFSRTYSKDGIEDKVVVTLFASANKDLTIDVSSVWSDGMVITNFYDGTTCKVSGGKVTFNTGANGTILMEEPQGAKGRVTVNHVLESTGETLKTTTMVGLLGDPYTTSPDAELTENYTVSRVTGSTTGTYSETEATVTYYYVFDDSKKGIVEVKHVDASTGAEIAEGTKMIGDIGSSYTASPATIKNYEVDLTKTNNATGTYQSGTITVTFYYNYVEPDYLSVHYYNSNNWSSVYAYIYDESGASVIEYTGAWPGKTMTAEGDGWFTIEVEDAETAQVIFNSGSDAGKDPAGSLAPGYDCTGTVYVKNGQVLGGGKVVVSYVSDSGKVLATETLTGMEGDTYTTSAKTFSGYTLVSTPANASGTFSSTTTNVIYSYKSDTAELVNNSTISSTSITKGNSVTLTGKASGGTSPYQYEMLAKLSTASSYTTLKSYNTTATKTWTPSSVGTYNVQINVKDASGTVVSKNLTLTVKAIATVLTNSSTISATTVTKGNSVTLTGKASGGATPYQYAMVAKHSTASSYTVLKNYSTTATKTWTPSKTGTYSVIIKVKDASGTVVSKSFTVTVKAATSALTNNSYLSTTTLNYGSTLGLSGSATGGTAPYQYAMVAKHSTASTWTTLRGYSTTATHTWKPAKTGTYTVQVKVKDANGTVVTKSFTLTVKAATTALTNSSTISATSITKGNSVT
ncbi:MAG: MucBP domain-containing protein, partial [Acutalibacteraceae bacterium]